MRLAGIGFLSLSGSRSDSEDTEYLRWHLLDHLPEQYQLRGLMNGQRWWADASCMNARRAGVGELADVRHMVLYLMEDESTLGPFLDLGRELWQAGRFVEPLPSLLAAPHRVVALSAADRIKVGAQVVPFRPNAGVYVVVEEPLTEGGLVERRRDLESELLPAVLAEPGCAGAMVLAAGDEPAIGAPAGAPWSDGRRLVTIVYLDDDPVEVSERSAALHDLTTTTQVSLAGPFGSLLGWRQWLGAES